MSSGPMNGLSANESDAGTAVATRDPLPNVNQAADESLRPGTPVKILMVDDQPANLLVLESLLAHLGHTLVTARSGEEALKCVLNDDFAVILLDVFMPGMDGFETAEYIRKRKRSRYTPIIFLTAIGTTDTDVSRGYLAGAVDYLFKPIVPHILTAKVAAFVELFLKTAMVVQQGEQLRQLEQQRHQAQLAEAKRQLEAEKMLQDMRAARKVQQLLYPRKPLTYPGFDIAGASYPTAATGGDYYDYFPSHDGNFDVVIGDVSGHGLAAALSMCSTRAYLRALTLTPCRIDQVLQMANRALAADMDQEFFVTLLYARINPSSLLLTYTSAGHPSGYVINAAGDVKSMMDSTAVPLGVVEDDDFPIGPPVQLESGDLMFLFTDGVIEAESPDGTFFGADRALQVIRSQRTCGAADIVNALHAAVKNHAQQSSLQDDLTVVVAKVL